MSERAIHVQTKMLERIANALEGGVMQEQTQVLSFRDRAAIELMPLAVELNNVTPQAALLAYQLADLLECARAVEGPIDDINEPTFNQVMHQVVARVNARGPRVDPGKPVKVEQEPGAGGLVMP